MNFLEAYEKCLNGFRVRLVSGYDFGVILPHDECSFDFMTKNNKGKIAIEGICGKWEQEEEKI